MDLLWEDEALTARQIREAIYTDSTRAQHGTVQRLLQRLEKKGFVQRDIKFGVQVFTPIVSRKSYSVSQIEALAAKLTSGSIAPLITHLVEEDVIDREVLDRIERMIEEKE